MRKLSPSQLQKLTDKWYDKLAKEGFDDIEERHSPREMLKTWHAHWWASRVKNESLARVQAKQDYYYFAQQFLDIYQFKCKLDREIWRTHSEALEIGKSIKALKTSRKYYNETISTIKKAMYEHFSITPTSPSR